jgi:hypothetical protein
MMPETMPIRLIITWTIVKVARLIPKTMMRSPFSKRANATTRQPKKPQPITPQGCAAGISAKL